jgi:hypothetical protein
VTVALCAVASPVAGIRCDAPHGHEGPHRSEAHDCRWDSFLGDTQPTDADELREDDER